MTRNTAIRHAGGLKLSILSTGTYLAHLWRRLEGLPILGYDTERAGIEVLLRAGRSHIRDSRLLLAELDDLIANGPEDNVDLA